MESKLWRWQKRHMSGAEVELAEAEEVGTDEHYISKASSEEDSERTVSSNVEVDTNIFEDAAQFYQHTPPTPSAQCFDLGAVSSEIGDMIRLSRTEFDRGVSEGAQMLGMCGVDPVIDEPGWDELEVDDTIWRPERRETRVACSTDKKVFDDEEVEVLLRTSSTHWTWKRKNGGCFWNREKAFDSANQIEREDEIEDDGGLKGTFVIEGREVVQGNAVDLVTPWTLDHHCRKLDAHVERSCRAIEFDGGCRFLECGAIEGFDGMGSFLCREPLEILEIESELKAHEDMEVGDTIWRPERRETRVACSTDKKVFDDEEVEVLLRTSSTHSTWKNGWCVPSSRRDSIYNMISFADMEGVQKHGEERMCGDGGSDQLSLETLLDMHLVETAPAYGGKGRRGLQDFCNADEASISEVRSSSRRMYIRQQRFDGELEWESHLKEWIDIMTAAKSLVAHMYIVCKEEHDIESKLDTLKRAHESQIKKVSEKSISSPSFMSGTSADDDSSFVGSVKKSIRQSISRWSSKSNVFKASSVGTGVKTDIWSTITRAILQYFPLEEMLMVGRGIFGGLSQILYVLILMFCWIYLFAVAGMMIFMKHDPWNFSTIETSMLLLLRIVTFENWGDSFYINYYGCDIYPGIPPVYTNEAENASSEPGGLMHCDTPLALPVTSTVFYVGFIAGGAFGILATLINVFSHSMETCLENYRQTQSMRKTETGHLEELAFDRIQWLTSIHCYSRKAAEVCDVLERCLQGESLFLKADVFLKSCPEEQHFLRYYLHVSAFANRLSNNRLFLGLVHLTTVLCVFTSYMETVDPHNAKLDWTNFGILVVFMIECAVNLLSEPYLWFFFEDIWNTFDLVIVVVSLLPSDEGDKVLAFRAIRAFRIIKLFRRNARLQNIIESLMSSLTSVMVTIVFAFLWMLLMAAVGWYMFGANDPMHFNGMGSSFVSVFQTMTLDGWPHLMYINAYGCDVYGYDESDKYLAQCIDPVANFIASAVYFTLLVASLSWILMNTFIGLMTVSAIETKSRHEFALKIRGKVRSLRDTSTLSRKEIQVIKMSFRFLDFFGRGVIGPLELKFALDMGRVILNPDEFDRLWSTTPKENIVHLNFYEFLLVMIEFRLPAKLSKSKKKEDSTLEDMLLSELGKDILPHTDVYVDGAQSILLVGEKEDSSESEIIEGIASLIYPGVGSLRESQEWLVQRGTADSVHGFHILPLPRVKSINEYLVARYPDHDSIDEFVYPNDPGGVEDDHERTFNAMSRMAELPPISRVTTSSLKKANCLCFPVYFGGTLTVESDEFRDLENERKNNLCKSVLKKPEGDDADAEARLKSKGLLSKDESVDDIKTATDSMNGDPEPVHSSSLDIMHLLSLDHHTIGCCLFTGESRVLSAHETDGNGFEEEMKMYQSLIVPPAKSPYDYLQPRFPDLTESDYLQHTMH